LRTSASGGNFGFDQWPLRRFAVRALKSERMVRALIERNWKPHAHDKARTMRRISSATANRAQWPLVKSEVATPLAEVRNRINEELARRQSNDALVPSIVTRCPTIL